MSSRAHSIRSINASPAVTPRHCIHSSSRESQAGKELNLPDGIHPNQAGVVTIVKNILPTVVRELETMKEKRAGSP
jgi:lysophospholipase L1-like esterase